MRDWLMNKLFKLIIKFSKNLSKEQKEEIFDKFFNKIASTYEHRFKQIFNLAEECNVKDTQGFLNLLDTLNKISIMY